jgi:protein O-GlcNAc transferase
LPVLTCTGAGYTGRMAASQLRAVGLPELVTGSLDEYEALALRLATEPGLIEGLRERLASNRDTAPLFDMARYTRHLEAAFRRMFEIWQRGDAPLPFAVEPLPREVRSNFRLPRA